MSEAEIVRGGAGMHHEAEMAVAERLDIVQAMQRDKFVAAPDEIPVADHRLLVCEPNQLCTGVEREINARDGARAAAIITVQSVLRVDLGNDRILLHFFKYMPHKSNSSAGVYRRARRDRRVLLLLRRMLGLETVANGEKGLRQINAIHEHCSFNFNPRCIGIFCDILCISETCPGQISLEFYISQGSGIAGFSRGKKLHHFFGKVRPALIIQNLFGTRYQHTDIIALIRNRHFIKLLYFHRLHHIGKKHSRRHEGRDQKFVEPVHETFYRSCRSAQ